MTCDRNMCYQQEYNDGGCNACSCNDKQSMTNQEIIEQLKSLKIHCEDFRDDEDSVWSKDVEALNKAIEAVEKQIPEKPNYVYEDEPLCPYCGAVLDDCESPCENCNQFIDWSDEDAD